MAGKTSEQKVTVDLTTGIGTLSFPHVFESTRSKNDKDEPIYDIQIIIPKSQTGDIKAIIEAVKTVGEAKWGDKWKKVRQPLRDGDKEKDDFLDDGSTKGDKYPERLGCFFLNARSTKPVAVVNRSRDPITNPDEVYGGCKGKISVSFYPYSSNGNTGIGCSLNGVQKVSDGEPFGNARPSVENMFDMLEGEDEDGEDPFAGVDDKPKGGKKDKGKKAKAEPEPAAKKGKKGKKKGSDDL
jgi:hypothetical protein